MDFEFPGRLNAFLDVARRREPWNSFPLDELRGRGCLISRTPIEAPPEVSNRSRLSSPGALWPCTGYVLAPPLVTCDAPHECAGLGFDGVRAPASDFQGCRGLEAVQARLDSSRFHPWRLDFVIQSFGAAGRRSDFRLARHRVDSRTLSLADRADGLHRDPIDRLELRQLDRRPIPAPSLAARGDGERRRQ